MTKRMMFVNDANKTTVDEYPVEVSLAEDQIDFKVKTIFEETATVTTNSSTSSTSATAFRQGVNYDGKDYGQLSGTVAMDLKTYYHSYDTGALDLTVTMAAAATGTMTVIHYYTKGGAGDLIVSPGIGPDITLTTAGSFVELVYTVTDAGPIGWKAMFLHVA